MKTPGELAQALAQTEAREQRAYEHQAHVYAERAQLLAVLSCLLPAHLTPRYRNRQEWSLCIHSPSGLLFWSLRPHELRLFAHLERLPESHWDGTTAEEQTERLTDLVRQLSAR